MVAICVAVALSYGRVPDAIIARLGGPRGGVDRDGGVKVRYRTPAGREVAAELPNIPADLARTTVDELAAGGLSGAAAAREFSSLRWRCRGCAGGATIAGPDRAGPGDRGDRDGARAGLVRRGATWRR
jgi:hypothetical protein